MSAETELDKGIAHLDFPAEEEKKEPPETRHYRHPIDSDRWWCGKLSLGSFPRPGLHTRSTPPEEITCVDCLHLFISKGGNWWWNVNKAWYGGNG